MSENKNNQIIKQVNNQLSQTKYSLAEIGKMAEYLAASKMCGIENKAQAFIILMIAENEGINPIQASLDYNIIKGNPTIKSSAALRRFLEAGGKMTYKTYTDTECTVEASHPKYGNITVTWTIEKASKIVDYYDTKTGKNHYLTDKANWKNYPRDMLKNRAVSEALRTIFPVGMKNLYTTEEASDFSNSKNIIDIELLQNQNNYIDNSNYNLDKDVFENSYDNSPYKKFENLKWSEMETDVLMWHINKTKMQYTHPEYYKQAVEELKKRNNKSGQEKKEAEGDKISEIDKLLNNRDINELDLKELKKLVGQTQDEVILKVAYDLIEKELKELDILQLVKARDYYTDKEQNAKLVEKIVTVLNEKLSVCPVGISKGMKWTELSIDKLNKYYKDYKDKKLTDYADEYASYIEQVLIEKGNQENKTDNTVITQANEDEDPFSTASDSDWDDMIEEQSKKENMPPNQIDSGGEFGDELEGFNF